MEHAMKMRIAIAVILAAVAFSTSAQSEQKFQKLTAAQIQARFPGMELTDEAHWGEVFERNGTLTITSMGHKRSASGGSRRTNFVSRPEVNLAEAATRYGFREKMWS
jgi:hypothetical protein